MFRFRESQEAVKWFVANALPFVNAKTVREKQTAFFEIWKRNSDLEEFSDYEKKYIGAKSFHGFIKDLLLIAFSFELPNLRDSEMISRESIELAEERIKSYLMTGDLWVSWNYKLCFVSVNPEIRKPAEYIEQIIVHSVLQSFYSMPSVFRFAGAFDVEENPPESDIIKGPGFDKVGICPNCGIFFEKKRKDQEYCSNRCRNNTQMRQYMRKRRSTKKKDKNVI